MFGQSVTFTATVNSSTASGMSGTVTFQDNSVSIGTGTVSGGIATYTTSATQLPAGTDTITAIYAGDTNFSGSLPSADFPQTVAPASTTTTVTSSTGGGTSVFGQSVTFTATVKAEFSGTPSGGTVTFFDGTTSLGAQVLNSGVATLTTSFNSAGSVTTHPITAIYDAVSDANFTASPTSAALNQTVNKASTTTTVTGSSSTSPVFGQSVTFTATVIAQFSGTPSGGTVTFRDNGSSIGTGVVTGGTATYTTSTMQLPAGTDIITAFYDGAGDANFTGSAASATFSQTVAKASTCTTLAPSEGTSIFGETVTFTATVTNTNTNVTPVGAVTFKDGGTSIGQAPLTVASASSATATFTTSSLNYPSSPHTLTAFYGGDGANFAGSDVSNSVTQTVSQASTTTTVTGSSMTSPVFGQSVTFTATVNSSTASGMSGTVTFRDNSVSIGTGTVSGGIATYATSATQLPAGTDTVTAVYGGDTNFSGSPLSVDFPQTVAQASTTTTVTSSSNTVVDGTGVTFTATVAVTPTGAGTPAGTVTFFEDGSTSLGTGSLSGTAPFQATYAASAAQLQPAGMMHPITAIYSDNDSANISGSTSTTLTQTVQQTTSTTVTSTPSTNPAVFGQSLSFTATVTVTSSNPDGHLPAGTVTFKDGSTSIGTGSITGTTATFTTNSLNVPGSGHTITAVYGGDPLSAASTSAASYLQSVNKASTTTTMTSSANPGGVGQSITFTATVVGQGGATGMTGYVYFQVDSTPLIPEPFVTGGMATFTTSFTGLGTHTITAVYGGTDTTPLIRGRQLHH